MDIWCLERECFSLLQIQLKLFKKKKHHATAFSLIERRELIKLQPCGAIQAFIKRGASELVVITISKQRFVLCCVALRAQRQRCNQRNWNIPEEWSTLFCWSSGTAKGQKEILGPAQKGNKTRKFNEYFSERQKKNRWQDSAPLMPIWALFPWIVEHVSLISRGI